MLDESNQTIIIMRQNILELNISINECETQNNDKSQQLEEKDKLILLLESDILNLTNKLSRFSGCRYDNPVCDQDHECINNDCVLKNGCKYNNPSCGNGFVCTNNSCIKIPRVTFRTNIFDKKYHLPYSEIAIDSDDDGQLECYKYTSFNWVYYSRYPKIITNTMEGLEVHKLPKERVIIYDHNRNPIYKKADTCSIPLSSEHISEYSTRET
jgi:hypothetical protein